MFQVINNKTGGVVGTFDNLESAQRDANSLNRQVRTDQFSIGAADPQDGGWAKSNGWERDEIEIPQERPTSRVSNEQFDAIASECGNEAALGWEFHQNERSNC